MKKTFMFAVLSAIVFSGCASSNEPQIYEPQIVEIAKEDTNATTPKIEEKFDNKIIIAKETTPFQPMPIKTPDKIVRILTLPYVDNSGILHSQSFKFVRVDEGEWVLGNYLTQKDGDGSSVILTPLK